MGYEPPEPVQDTNDIVVEFLFVHGGHDLVHFGVYGGEVALPPVQECIIAYSCGVEVLRAPNSHDSGVVLNECLGNSVGVEQGDYQHDVTVCTGVVVPQEPDSVGYTGVIVE